MIRRSPSEPNATRSGCDRSSLLDVVSPGNLPGGSHPNEADHRQIAGALMPVLLEFPPRRGRGSQALGSQRRPDAAN
jgi:hypothetical protein